MRDNDGLLTPLSRHNPTSVTRAQFNVSTYEVIRNKNSDYTVNQGSCRSSLAVGLSSGIQVRVLRMNRRKPVLSSSFLSRASKVRSCGMGARSSQFPVAAVD